MDIHLPAGIAGPEPLEFDVRCFLVTHRSGVVLIDAGLDGSQDAIGSGLRRIGAEWDDVTDVVLTHGHQDHAGGLAGVVAHARHAAVWVGASDHPAIAFDGEVRSLVEGGTIRDLRVLETPGHTPGHCSLLLGKESVLFAGDIIGSMAGTLSRGPAAFTADPDEAERSLRRVAGLENFDRVLFSHGAELEDPVHQLRNLLNAKQPGQG
jgi:glyoxylase-like metal-dependent hydrolase (beta-lactamase superfamily II)